MSSAMQNTLGKCLNFIYLVLKHIAYGAVPNGSLLYLYLPNWHVNVVRYDDPLSNLRLWYPELASIRGKYFTLFNFGPGIALLCQWALLQGKNYCTILPFLLHLRVLLYALPGVFPILFKCFLQCICYTPWDACYGLLPGFTCNKNFPSKHLVPVNTSSNSFCSCFVISVLSIFVSHFVWTWKKLFNFIIV